jgi:hypothetical protein
MIFPSFKFVLMNGAVRQDTIPLNASSLSELGLDAGREGIENSPIQYISERGPSVSDINSIQVAGTRSAV